MQKNRLHSQQTTAGIKFFILIVFMILIMIYGFLFFEQQIKPAVFSISEMKVKEIANEAINESINEKFNEQIDYHDLVRIEVDKDGNVVLLQANTVFMNRIASDMALVIQKNIRDVTGDIKIPVGGILGSQILSQYGPMIRLTVVPMGVAKVNFKTEFEEAGINQTRHKIYLEVNTSAKVIIPLKGEIVSINTIVPIAETIIVGEVPDSFITVPREEIFNFAD
ncbi:MAG: sporulation protein YunB [Peptostreptococcales bacterium]